MPCYPWYKRKRADWGAESYLGFPVLKVRILRLSQPLLSQFLSVLSVQIDLAAFHTGQALSPQGVGSRERKLKYIVGFRAGKLAPMIISHPCGKGKEARLNFACNKHVNLDSSLWPLLQVVSAL